LNHKNEPETDGVPVPAGECGVCPQWLFEPRSADFGADPTYCRTWKSSRWTASLRMVLVFHNPGFNG